MRNNLRQSLLSLPVELPWQEMKTGFRKFIWTSATTKIMIWSKSLAFLLIVMILVNNCLLLLKILTITNIASTIYTPRIPQAPPCVVWLAQTTRSVVWLTWHAHVLLPTWPSIKNINIYLSLSKLPFVKDIRKSCFHANLVVVWLFLTLRHKWIVFPKIRKRKTCFTFLTIITFISLTFKIVTLFPVL